MSVKVLSKVWEHYPSGGSSLLVMLALADWSDDEGRCFPSIASIAKKTRLSDSQARRVVHDMINMSYVQVVGNKNGGAKGSSRRYKINIQLLTASTNATPAADARASTDARDDWHGCAETASAHASLTVIEPSLTIKDFELPDWIPIQAWNAYLEHRNKLKKPLTDYSMNLAIQRLQKIVDEGHQPADIINETILKGWQTFYAPKNSISEISSMMQGLI